MWTYVKCYIKLMGLKYELLNETDAQAILSTDPKHTAALKPFFSWYLKLPQIMTLQADAK